MNIIFLLTHMNYRSLFFPARKHYFDISLDLYYMTALQISLSSTTVCQTHTVY